MNIDRMWNRFLAWQKGCSWTECPVCKQMFGGHERADDSNGHRDSIPGSSMAFTTFTARGICPVCTAKGEGDRAWEAHELRVSEIAEKRARRQEVAGILRQIRHELVEDGHSVEFHHGFFDDSIVGALLLIDGCLAKVTAYDSAIRGAVITVIVPPEPEPITVEIAKSEQTDADHC